MNFKKGRQPDPRREQFDAAPGDDDVALAVGRPPQNIGDTKVFKAGKQAGGRLWNNYKQHLVTSFRRMSRAEQEALVQRICMIITIGVTGVALLMFYQFIPRLARVFGVPAAVVGAWWLGKNMITQVVLARIEDILNKVETLKLIGGALIVGAAALIMFPGFMQVAFGMWRIFLMIAIAGGAALLIAYVTMFIKRQRKSQ
jgi:hypothetical protein